MPDTNTVFTDSDARKIFDDAIASSSDPDVRATRQILREYFCNPEFRAALHDEVYRINQPR